MDIIEAVYDKKLFGNFLGDDLRSWRYWLSGLRALYGLELDCFDQRVVWKCMKRDPRKLPSEGFSEALFLCGRRGGKSTISAIVAAYEACLGEGRKNLSPGEEGVVLVIAPGRRQAMKVRDFCRAIFGCSAMLENEVVAEQAGGFSLRGNVRIEIGVADHRMIRGHTLLCVVIDEICFLQHDPETKIRNDKELVQALRPSLITTGGKLICISSPYAKKGWAYNTWKKNFGKDSSDILVWRAASRTMNSQLSQKVIDRAMAEDRAAARSEFLAEWRDDISGYLMLEVIEACVIAGRKQLLPREDKKYFGFVDVSGGRNDSATLAIAHRSDRKVVIDQLQEWRAPFSPVSVITDMCAELRRYGLRQVIGDNYSAEFAADAFRNNGMGYSQCAKAKSVLYLEMLPRLCSQEIELPDNPRLIGQLANLERRTKSGGKDQIDHPAGAHDDLCNAIAGVSVVCAGPMFTVGLVKIDLDNERHIRL